MRDLKLGASGIAMNELIGLNSDSTLLSNSSPTSKRVFMTASKIIV